MSLSSEATTRFHRGLFCWVPRRTRWLKSKSSSTKSLERYGAVFGSLVVIRWRLPRFYLLFALAFFMYAAGWMIAYFTLHRTAGEVVGSVVGSVLMGLVFAIGFGALRSTIKLSVVLFILNFLRYFLGAAILNSLRSPTGMLLFGVVYGLFFGAGIGAVLQMVQQVQRNEFA